MEIEPVFRPPPLTDGSGTKMPDRRDDIPSRQVGNECHSLGLMLPRRLDCARAHEPPTRKLWDRDDPDALEHQLSPRGSFATARRSLTSIHRPQINSPSPAGGARTISSSGANSSSQRSQRGISSIRAFAHAVVAEFDSVFTRPLARA